jgi:predicted membrane protein
VVPGLTLTVLVLGFPFMGAILLGVMPSQAQACPNGTLSDGMSMVLAVLPMFLAAIALVCITQAAQGVRRNARFTKGRHSAVLGVVLGIGCLLAAVCYGLMSLLVGAFECWNS